MSRADAVPTRLADRDDAGRRLAEALSASRGDPAAIVLGLPRGGVPVAAAIADALEAPLDLVVVRKLGLPGQPELAMGAIASGGVRVTNDEVVRASGVRPDEVDRVAARETVELARRETAYRGRRAYPALRGRRVILVDDGVATGSTMLAAIDAVRRQHPESITVAVPVAPHDTLTRLRAVADRVVCLSTPEPFHAIGLWYDEFEQLSDEAVRQALARAWSREAARGGEDRGRGAGGEGRGNDAVGEGRHGGDR